MDNNPRCACISEAVSCSPIGNSCQIIGRHIKFSILYLHCGVWVFYAPTTQNTARPEAIFMHQCGQPHIRTNLTISCMEYDIDQVKPQSIMNSWWADFPPATYFGPTPPTAMNCIKSKTSTRVFLFLFLWQYFVNILFLGRTYIIYNIYSYNRGTTSPEIDSVT